MVSIGPLLKRLVKTEHCIKKHVTFGGQTRAILSGKLPDMHVSQVWLISLLAGSCQAIQCILNSRLIKRATLTVNNSDKYSTSITFLEPPNPALFGIFELAGHFQQCWNLPTVNLTLSLIHPELFKCRLSMLQKLWQLEMTNDVAWKWQSVTNSFSSLTHAYHSFYFSFSYLIDIHFP